MSFQIVINQSVTQDVQLDAADAETLVVTDFRYFVEGYLGSVNDRCRALSKNLKDPVAVEHDGSILVDADAQIVRVIRDSRNETADAPAFGKMLINNDVF